VVKDNSEDSDEQRIKEADAKLLAMPSEESKDPLAVKAPKVSLLY